MQQSLKETFEYFEIPGSFVSAEPYGSGHINDTYKVRVKPLDEQQEKKNLYYILQRINNSIFTKPVEVMENIQRVTSHLRKKIQARGGDPKRETLTLLPIKSTSVDSDAMYYAIVNGNYWRVYDFIDDARSYDIGETAGTKLSSSAVTREVASTFARFQCDLADLPPPRLHETIPNFGDTAYRFKQFEEALGADKKCRADNCREEIEFCLKRKPDASILSNLLRDGTIPERIVHYDTKINNVLIDNNSGKGLCVIDLDTVMPGLGIYDFGDAVRAASALAAEDETDLSKVGFSMEKFESLTDGYISEAKEFLSDTELDHLAFSARLVCFIVGLRFLTDYLNGDVYFKIDAKIEHHNLHRARTQMKMVVDMEYKDKEMIAIVEKYRKGSRLSTL